MTMGAVANIFSTLHLARGKSRKGRIMGKRTRLATVVVAGLAGLGGVLVVAAPAQAYVSSCEAIRFSPNQGGATCHEGSGWFRVLVDCANVGGVRTVAGDWLHRDYTTGPNGGWSTAGCGSGYATNIRLDAK